ncbi:MAG: carbonic anhydrase [Polyangiaceae bacterium]
MTRIIDGASRYERENRSRYLPLFAQLGTEQHPHTLFVTCADSRVVPNLIAGGDPGDLFVVRNIGNLVPPANETVDASVPSAVAYAIDVLGVSDIVICGHSSCGAMKALLAEPPANPHLRRWLEIGRPSVDALRSSNPMGEERPIYDRLSMLNAIRQVETLRTYPVVRDRLEKGTLALHAWWFDVAEGRVLVHSARDARYISVEQVAAKGDITLSS